MMIQRRRFLEHNDGGRDKGVTKLRVGRTIAMNMQKFNVFGQVCFDAGRP